MNGQIKSNLYLSCTQVARQLGLSRQRFWQLRRDGVFPEPQIDRDSGRPYYSQEQLELCLDLRRRNVGMNGQVVLFYSARTTKCLPKPKATRSKMNFKPSSCHADMIESLKALGLSGVDDAQVDDAMTAVFPSGTDGIAQGEQIRAIFLHIQRQNSPDNVS
jgi:biotin operon repressor